MLAYFPEFKAQPCCSLRRERVNEHFILKRDISQWFKTANPNTHIHDPCETGDNGLFCTVGIELNLTRSLFYAEYIVGHCWRRWRNQINGIFMVLLFAKTSGTPLVYK